MPAPDSPRITPLDRDDADERQSELLDALGPAAHLNLFRTLAHHPKLMRAWLPFGGRLLQGSSLSPRDRELVILRVAAWCESDYEWGQHVGIARMCGLDDDEITRCAAGSSDPAWSDDDRILLAATEELVRDRCLGDGRWDELARRYEPAQIMELTMLAGHYAMLAGMLRSVGVRTEEPLPPVGRVSPADRDRGD